MDAEKRTAPFPNPALSGGAVEREKWAIGWGPLSPLVFMALSLRAIVQTLSAAVEPPQKKPWPSPWVARRRPDLPGPPGDLRVADMSPAEFEAFQLWSFGEAGVPAVRIVPGSSGSVARACRGTVGTVMSVETAMRDRPIPHDSPDCRCVYEPVRRLDMILRHGRR